MTKRLHPAQSLGGLIDVQDFFLAAVEPALRPALVTNIANLARLLDYFRIPVIATCERPLAEKGALPTAIAKRLGGHATIFEKDFFDLTREKKIRDHLRRLRKRQVILAGCESDVCVLQSCLGLIDLHFEVYVVEDLVFSSSSNVDAALARMAAEGAVLVTYKSLYYELLGAVGDSDHAQKLIETFGPFPDDLPDCALA